MLEHHQALELSPASPAVPMMGAPPEESHEIVTGTTRAHTSSPRTLPGNTDHADIVHLPDTRGAGPPVRVGGSDVHRTGSFRDGDPRSARIPARRRWHDHRRNAVKLIKTEAYENGNREREP